MKMLVELLAYLILTMIGLVVPIGAIILSSFSRGLIKLSRQYEAESGQTKKKLTDQLRRAGESDAIDEKQIVSTIKELRKIKKTAENKLQLLSPKKAVLNLFLPLLLSFLALLPILVQQSAYNYALFVLSIICLLVAFSQFWKLLDIIVETTELIERDSKDEQRRIPELLAEIASSVKQGARYFLEKVYISFLGVDVKNEVNQVALIVNNKIEIPVLFTNNEARMAKDVEAGFRFPMEFLVEKKTGYTITTSDEDQIVRYSLERVHANTTQRVSTLIITPLKAGTYEIKTFIKAENIETKYRLLKVAVDQPV